MMKFDLPRAIGAVTREVASREQEGKPARVVVAGRSYDGAIEDVWDALTNPERIPRWFLPVSGELRLGGRFQLEGNAGGKILRCEPPRLLAVTWVMGAGPMSWVTVTLAPEGAGVTRLELEHIVPVDEHWEKFGAGAVGVGWDLALMMGLERHLASGAAVDPQAAAAWTASEEGKAFVRATSADWCRASIAGGAEEAWAKAAAARTTAAYGG